MKKNRQMKILELIEQYKIGTQEELIEKLSKEGYNATQATVSRDIRNLKLVKTMTDEGTYRYQQAQREDLDRLNVQEYRAYADAILNVVYSLNNVVIRTRPGIASAIALLLDKKAHELVLGTVAGDDTIIVVTRSPEDSAALTEQIRRYQKNREI